MWQESKDATVGPWIFINIKIHGGTTGPYLFIEHVSDFFIIAVTPYNSVSDDISSYDLRASNPLRLRAVVIEELVIPAYHLMSITHTFIYDLLTVELNDISRVILSMGN